MTLKPNTADNIRIRQALRLMGDGYGREDIAIIDGDAEWVNRLYQNLQTHGVLLRAYGVAA